jgi:hypothetical protein
MSQQTPYFVNCIQSERGEAADKRQQQDNNGGPKNEQELADRKEWNRTIHCPKQTPKSTHPHNDNTKHKYSD